MTSTELRQRVEDWIEQLIELLDHLDGDPELELQCEDEGAQCEDEGAVENDGGRSVYEEDQRWLLSDCQGRICVDIPRDL